MVIAKQMDIRANIKKYFDVAFNGEPVVVPRKENRNVVIISETLYNELTSKGRMQAYSDGIRHLASDKKPAKRPVPSDIRSFNNNKLDTIASLQKGWNGNGAPAIPGEVIERVRMILKRLEIQPEIFPTALQTIQFEFDNTRRDHMEIEVGMEETAEVFIARYDGMESFEDIPVDADAINERVRAFYG